MQIANVYSFIAVKIERSIPFLPEIASHSGKVSYRTIFERIKRVQ